MYKRQVEQVLDALEENGVDVLHVIEEEPDEAVLMDQGEEVDLENIDLSVPEGVGTEDPVRMYLKEIGKVDLLSSEEEILLAERMEQGDEEAKKRLLEANLRLVVSLSLIHILDFKRSFGLICRRFNMS